MQVKKASLLPKYLQMQFGYEELKAKPFKMPFKGYPSVSKANIITKLKLLHIMHLLYQLGIKQKNSFTKTLYSIWI